MKKVAIEGDEDCIELDEEHDGICRRSRILLRKEKMEMGLESWRRVTGVLACGSIARRMIETPNNTHFLVAGLQLGLI